jgi:hypothetical protein
MKLFRKMQLIQEGERGIGIAGGGMRRKKKKLLNYR